MLDENRQYDVFISYARKDGSALAERLDHSLTAEGFRTWRDTRGIDPSRDFTAEIERAIKTSGYVVVCITPDTERDTSFVRREIQFALLSGKPVIVARFQDVIPPIHIVNNTWVEFHTGWDAAFRHLCRILRLHPQDLDQPAPSDETADPFRPYVERVYGRVVNFLNRAVIKLVDLAAEDKPVVVETPPTDMLDQFFTTHGLSTSTRQTSSFATFAEAFERYQGRVLLLGQPGSGKTITLMAFARDAAARRLSNPAAPLPLLGLISTWNADEQPPLWNWFAESYPGLDESALQTIINEGKALLLLDALDELGDEREDPRTKETYDPRSRFLQVIPQNNQVIISCRAQDFSEIGEQTSLNGPVVLQPLNDAQIEAYLADYGDLWNALETDADLREMTRTPLLLSLFAFAYHNQKENAYRLRDLRHSPSELREKIFEMFVQRRYEHEQRKQNADLPFSLPEIYEALGRIAMENAGGFLTVPNMMRRRDFSEVLDVVRALDFILLEISEREQSDEFIDLAMRLHFVMPQEEDTFRFIHLLLRDFFAFKYARAALKAPDDRLRAFAAVTLGKLRDIRAVGPLIRLVENDGVDVRASAAFALGELGDARAVEALVTFVRDEHMEPHARSRAAEALGKIGSPDTIAPLIDALRDTPTPVQGSAVRALESIGTPDALAAVEQWRREQESQG